ncbi:hypothetical protein KBC89_01425 [Candidatus Woesebacteria bacterium]|nr:hypothetical protein [Candidatus Woesebacteria bacterium]
MNTKIIQSLCEIVPTLRWSDDVTIQHLQLSNSLAVIAEQLSPNQQAELTEMILDTEITSNKIAKWLTDQIPQITLLLRELESKVSLITRNLQS